MATKEIMIQGLKFTATTPYEAGHQLTEVEAKVLNQTRLENLRNNFASTVKAANEGGEGAPTADDLPRLFAEYDGKYTFAMPSTGGGARKLDPVEREARALAIEIIRDNLAAETPPRKYADVKKANPEKLEAKIDELSLNDQVIKLAKQRVSQKAKVLETVSAGLAGGSGPEPEAVAAE